MSSAPPSSAERTREPAPALSLRAALALAAALLLAGGAFDLASLYVPGIALALLTGGTLAWAWLATRGVRVERSPSPATVTEGEAYPIRVRIRGGLVPPRGELVDPLLPGPEPISIVGRGTRVGVRRAGVSFVREARFERRGRRRIEPARIVVRDPLGLHARVVTGSPGGEVLVLPRIEPVLAPGARAGEDGEGSDGLGEGIGSGLGGSADVEIDGLRPYRQGSPASRIHWPAVARHGDLIERQLASGSDGTSLVVLDGGRASEPEALDCAARAAASLCFHLARAGGCSLIAAGSGRALKIDRQLRGWPQAHARLALVEPGEAVAPGVRGSGTDATTFWVSAAPDGVPPRGLARGSLLVSPHASAARAAFTVAGCHGVVVGASRAGRRMTRRAA